ncbi:MAG: hypothetical protein ABDH19_08395 [Thermodesulfovibrio sp.]
MAHGKINFSKRDIILIVTLLALLFFLSHLSILYFGSFIQNVSHHVHGMTIVYEYVKTIIEIGLIVFASLKGKSAWKWIKNQLVRKEFKGTGEHFDYLKEKVKAIVIPVSRREQPEWIINHLNPEYVALLYTEQSKEVASQITKDFSENIHFVRTVSEIDKGVDMIKNPDDPLESKSLTRKYIEQFIRNGVDESNIFVDTTGGKVPMSIGAFQAAEEMGVSSIYIVGRVNGKIVNPQIREHGDPIFISRKKI